MKILSVDDMFAVAKKVHEKQGGRIGLLPFFSLVLWTNERMGLSFLDRVDQIEILVSHAQQEKVYGERTPSAISFDGVMEDLLALLPIVEKAVAEARKE